MKSDVYFLPIEKINLIGDVIKRYNFFNFVKKEHKIALKIHFGSTKHKNNIKVEFLKPVIDFLKKRADFIFLSDTNVLYRGERSDTFSHLKVIFNNNFQALGIPFIIAGGFDCDDEVEIDVNWKNFKKIYIAKEYTKIDGMIALTHFKGHVLSGIGGTIKNIGMGCASRKGKFAMHANIVPQININSCKGCGACVLVCPVGAIKIENKRAKIDENLCIGCAACVHACRYGVISIPWSSVSSDQFQERLVEYAYCVINQYKGNFFAINFLMNITPDCDCMSNPGEKIIDDIGVLFSSDPVAIDKASIDLINKKAGHFVR